MVLFLVASCFVAWISLKSFLSRRSLSSSFKTDPRLFDDFNRVLFSEHEPHHLPAVLVDLDAFDKNISFVRDRMSLHPHLSVRIASKSIRVPFLLRRILSTGPPYRGLMCYAVEEAEFLAGQGFDDLLIAYPSQQTLDYRILRALHEDQGKVVSLVVDHAQSICSLNDYMAGVSRPFPVVLEFDSSFRMLGGCVHVGARRSPIRTLPHLIEMIELIERSPFLRLEGLMVYESHVAGIGDRNPANAWLNPMIRQLKRMSIPQIEELRQEMSRLCSRYNIRLFNGGGTGSFLSVLSESSILTEITIGSGFFQPHLFDHYEQNQSMISCYGSSFLPSCYFALPIVRVSDEGEWVTCSGGGYVASGRPGWDKAPLPVFPLGLTLNDSEGTGEVQTPVKIDPARTEETRRLLEANRVVYFRHAKGGELAERFLTFLLVANGNLVEVAQTYRGYGKCFF